MRNWWKVILGLILGILAAGIILLASQQPRGNVIMLLPPPSPIPLQVHISGAVLNPGVYALPPNSRMIDAIEAAGGFTQEADASSLNLAFPLEDGTRVEIPVKIPSVYTVPPPTTPFGDDDSLTKPTLQSIESSIKLININTADQTTLETLSGIGPVTAQNIITFRQENGPFTSIEEIQKVYRIGPVTFAKIRDLITVEEQP